MTAANNIPDPIDEVLDGLNTFYVEAARPYSPKDSGMVRPTGIKPSEAKLRIEEMLIEARYMGTMDLAEWVMHHDESSFRQERAWFKLKPNLIMRYQAELMKNLKRIWANVGLDKDSTVHQLKSEETTL